MGTIMLNGIQYGGGSDFAGAAFLDTDNVIVSLTALPSSVVEYTATEDCYLYVQLGGQNQENYVTINGEQIFYTQATNWQMEGELIPLAKGQTAEIHGRQTNNYYAVYGVKYSGGSSGSSGISYSTTEQDTGLKWIDGSAIYQKTIDFGTMPSNQQEKDVEHGISNLAFVVDMEFIVYNSTQGQWRLMPSVSRGNILAQSVYGVDSQYVFVLGGQNADVDSNWTGIVTIRYTKSSS